MASAAQLGRGATRERIEHFTGYLERGFESLYNANNINVEDGLKEMMKLHNFIQNLDNPGVYATVAPWIVDGANDSVHINMGTLSEMDDDNYGFIIQEAAREFMTQFDDIFQDELDEALGLVYSDGILTQKDDDVEAEDKGISKAEVQIERVEKKSELLEEPVARPRLVTVHHKDGTTTERYKRTPWKMKGQKKGVLSKQERFILTRKGGDIEETQQSFIGKFRIYRSKSSLRTKQYRLTKAAKLAEQQRIESKSNVMGPN